MYIDFKELPEDARVWVYQCNRSFTEEEQQQLHAQLEEYLNQWTVHGKDLLASFELRYNRFIIIGANYGAHAISGCSLDALVRFIQELEEQYQVMLLDRMNVSYRQGEHIAYKNLIDFKKMPGLSIIFSSHCVVCDISIRGKRSAFLFICSIKKIPFDCTARFFLTSLI